MDKHTKDLIAVGAAIGTNCQPCLKKLVEAARENGAEEKDIMTAIAVGNMVRNGAIGKMEVFVSTMFNDLESCKVESPCGCG